MEKLIMTWSYWLGLLCVPLAFLARALNAIGFNILNFQGKGAPVGYRSFLDAAQIFLLVAISTAAYSWLRSEKS